MKKSILLCVAVLTAMHSVHIQCAPGDLDVATFGIGGLVLTNLGREDYIYSCTVQTDDSIVVVGASQVLTSRMGVARYTENGELDTTFNTTGTNAILIGDASAAQGVIVQSDGKILFSGYISDGRTDMPLVRLNTNGTLDASFTATIGDGGQGSSIVQQPDTKFVIGGVAVSGQGRFALARFNNDGTLDTTGFGTSGTVTTTIGYYAVINQVALQSDGKIVAAGVADEGGGFMFALARYNTDGTLDDGFGPNSDGIVTNSDIGAPAQINSVVIQDDGYIVVAGYATDSADGIVKFALARYDTTGELDASFGDAGIVLTQIRHDAKANSVILQPNGQLLVGGYSYGDLSTDFALARYNTDGSLDTSFGIDGISLVNPGIHRSDSQITSLVLQSTGKIIAAGFSDSAFTVARFLAA